MKEPVNLARAARGDVLKDAHGRFWVRTKDGADYLKDGFSPPVDWPSEKLEQIALHRGPFVRAEAKQADAIRAHMDKGARNAL